MDERVNKRVHRINFRPVDGSGPLRRRGLSPPRRWPTRPEGGWVATARHTATGRGRHVTVLGASRRRTEHGHVARPG